MAELPASIAGLLSLTITVIDVSHRYFSSARNATKTVKRYFRELDALRLLLGEFDTAEAETVSPATTNAIEGCQSELERLRSSLQKRTSTDAFQSAIHRLKWPFAEEETRNLVEAIHRYLGIFHAALSVESVKLNNTTLEAVKRVETRFIDSERKRLLRLLSSVDPFSNHTAARKKHGAATGRWFLESQEFIKWSEGEHGSLWIVGIPGAGKTILCSTAIEHLQNQRAVNEAVLIWYFDFSNNEKKKQEALLRCLLRQACDLLDVIPSDIAELISGHASRQTPLDIDQLAEALKTVLAGFESVSIVIDALDESAEVVRVLNLLQEWNSDSCRNLRWLMTSRRKQEIQDALEDSHTTVVVLNSSSVGDDIRRYVCECLAEDSKLCSRPNWIKRQIENVLVNKAQGMFRWVECQLEVIRRCRTAPAIEAALRTLPETLDATYERILDSINDEDRIHARAALELLAFAKRPLRVEEVAEAAVIVPGCKSFDPDDRFFDPKDILSICAGLIERIQDTNDLVLSHYSVREFLTSRRIHQGSAAFFQLDDQASHIRVAETCLTYLLSLQENVLLYEGIDDDYPFLDYAARNWFEHIPENAIGSASMLTSLVTTLMSQWHDGCPLDWTDYIDSDVFFFDERLGIPHEGVRFRPSAVGMMCVLEKVDVALQLHQLSNKCHQNIADCGILLQSAIEAKNHAMVEKMVSSGCSLGVAFADGNSPLCSAIKKGDFRMVELLIRLGAVVTGRVPSAWVLGSMVEVKPLLAAARHRRVDLLEVLIRAGADPDMDAGEHGGILSYLIADRNLSLPASLEAARLLIAAGAKASAYSQRSGSPLHAFLSRLFPPMTATPGIIRYLQSRDDEESSICIDELKDAYGTILFMLATTLNMPLAELPLRLSKLPNGPGTQDAQGLYYNETDDQAANANAEIIVSIVRLLLANGADPNGQGRLYPQTVRFTAENTITERGSRTSSLLEQISISSGQVRVTLSRLYVPSHSNRWEV